MSDTKPAGVPWTSWAKKTLIALFAGATGVLGVLVIAVTAGSDGGAKITTPEWLQAATVALTAIGGSFGVYVARNQDQPVAARRDTGWKRDQGGYTGNPVGLLVWLLVAIVVVILIVWLLRVLFAAA